LRAKKLYITEPSLFVIS